MSKCLGCGSSVEPVLDFGKMPIANGFLSPKDYENEFFFDLTVAL